MIVYIAGPMRGYKEFNREAFFSMEYKLMAEGWTVLNPAYLPTNLPETSYMPICISMIDQCDAIVFLKGWKKSLGARTEYCYGKCQGKILLEEI